MADEAHGLRGADHAATRADRCARHRLGMRGWVSRALPGRRGLARLVGDGSPGRPAARIVLGGSGAGVGRRFVLDRKERIELREHPGMVIERLPRVDRSGSRGFRLGPRWGAGPQGFAADLALLPVRRVVRATVRTEDEVEDVPFPRPRRLLLRLEFDVAPRAPIVFPRDKAPAVRADEQESALPAFEDTGDVAVVELSGVSEPRVDELEGLLAIETEGSAEADDCLVDDEGPAVVALRLVRGQRLLADGAQGPGLFPGHRCRRFHPAGRHINPATSLSGLIQGVHGA